MRPAFGKVRGQDSGLVIASLASHPQSSALGEQADDGKGYPAWRTMPREADNRSRKAGVPGCNRWQSISDAAMNLSHNEGEPRPHPPETGSRTARHIPPEALEALANHPQLTEATVKLFTMITSHQAAQGLLRFVVGDRGRRAAFWGALALHTEREFGDGIGLTVNRFCDRLHEHGDMSRGRARALFIFMRHVGFLERSGVDRPGIYVPYVPTDRMMALATERLSRALEALSIISQTGTDGRAALDDPDFPLLLCMKIGSLVGEGIRPLASEPSLKAFSSRDGGEYIAMHLFLAHAAATPQEQRDGFVFQLTACAKQTHVSRPHVSNMIRDAADDGLLKRRGREEIILTDLFLTSVSKSVVLTLAYLEKMTRSALADFNRRA
ncbi:hypothetical protein RDV64_18225 [Acuticoccus sp. MNP-M23]|uniref:hypothetical protein n=1 Tax=Acuticoccus sp. MNP-M23 TaxID=3072793 RepID=UPI0028166259|nr:hypothetical protein [Acuticoccus sp. MNP-M23]WMS41985.1 hypothetical protein RDV64_18225 [Acuticoccus sp. MNP-M23]